MTTTELLAQFANPETIENLSAADKLTAGLFTTVLGMGITFVALVVLLIVISLMDKLLNKPAQTENVDEKTVVTAPSQNAEEQEGQVSNDQEIVAAITTSIAMTVKTSVSNIVIKNIEKIEDTSPPWNRAGIIEQMNSRL